MITIGFERVELDIVGDNITFGMLTDVIGRYANLSQFFSIAGTENNYHIEGTFRISSERDVKKFGETLVEATNGGTFFLIGRTNYSFLTGIMDFIIECRGVNAGFDNPAWCYVTSKFTEDGFETSEDVFKLPLE